MELFRETATTLTVILVNGLHIRGELARASRKRDALATGERKALEHTGTSGMIRGSALRVVLVVHINMRDRYLELYLLGVEVLLQIYTWNYFEKRPQHSP